MRAGEEFEQLYDVRTAAMEAVNDHIGKLWQTTVSAGVQTVRAGQAVDQDWVEEYERLKAVYEEADDRLREFWISNRPR
jgi:hypothetical protein